MPHPGREEKIMADDVLFDIRRYMDPGPANDPRYQKGYNVANRLTTLFGNIPFNDLFGQPWAALIATLHCNIELAGRNDPEVDVKTLKQLVMAVGDNAGGHSFGELIRLEWCPNGGTIPNIFAAFREAGVPLIDAGKLTPAGAARRAAVLAGLTGNPVPPAGAYTYRTIYTEHTECDAIKNAAKGALKAGKEMGILSIAINGRCCSDNNCGTVDPNSYCSVVNGHCSVASDLCV
jgi:hypothetical protein